MCASRKTRSQPIVDVDLRLDWVFAYGSLMWSPEFAPVMRRRATLVGYHRSLCLYSWHHRGTREHPGLVFGLDVGGCCVGTAQAFPLHATPRILARLDHRELPDDSYVRRRVRLETEAGPLTAWAYLVNHASVQYAGALDDGAIARLVAGAVGRRGTNADYVASTLAHLRDLDIAEPRWHAVAAAVDAGDHGVS